VEQPSRCDQRAHGIASHLSLEGRKPALLLADGLFRAARSAIASFAVIVDEGAHRFYERESFLPFLDQPMRLFRAIEDITVLFK
jgi:hypothetical protein